MWIFSEKNQLCHTQPYMGPKHHAKFQKKLMNQCRENLQTDGRTDGRWTDRPYFIGPFRPRPGVQKRLGAWPPEPPIGFWQRPIAKLTVPPDPNIQCRIILWFFFTNYNIHKLNLLSKTDISKIAWINPCEP